MDNREMELYRQLDIVQFSGDDFERQSRDVVVELPIIVDLLPSGLTLSTMGTPSQIDCWVVGHLFSERLIESASQVKLSSIELKERECRVSAEIISAGQTPSHQEDPAQNGLAISSSGERSVRTVESTIRSLRPVADRLRADTDAIFKGMDAMHAMQKIHRRTRGTHAMAMVWPDGSMYSFSEDVGRHNALDKVIGECLINGDSPADFIVVMSSRISLEMLCKAARAGIELVVAIGCPTTFAIEVGQQVNVTIAGRVRDREISIYTHPWRIINQQHDT